MDLLAPPTTRRSAGQICALVGTIAAIVACFLTIDDPASARAAALAALCLGLWLGEVVPPFVPTLVLLVGSSAGFGAAGSTLASALAGMADPVLALFFGGFVLGEAASAHGLDRVVLRRAVGVAGGRVRALVAVVLAVTAFLSMWMSNIAAAALMLASLKPALEDAPDPSRRALLAAVALGANVGGMATPIGTGPNAIAISAIEDPPSFLGWMAFALPLTVGALVVALVLLVVGHRLPSDASVPSPVTMPTEGRPGAVAVLGALAIAAWLSEPIHGLPAAVVSLIVAAVVFGAGLLPPSQVSRLDWSTLLLVAGGIGLGHLVEDAGLLDGWAAALTESEAPRGVVVLALLGATATMSALMSNTATAALLVPVAMALDPDDRSLPILIAMAASFGMPFVISTPPNAMVVGAGGWARDLLIPGLVLMVGGCIVLAVTGPIVLGRFGY